MLRIVGRRADGYHLLQTVYQFIDWGDELFFQPRPDGRIRRQYRLPGVTEQQDLVMRAAKALQQFCATRLGVDIRLYKRLPQGGGLGGASSDAATTLVALNRLWELGLTTQQLAAVGVQLGADVPVFVYGNAAWAEGIGELLSPLPLPEPWYVVVFPSRPVSTEKIFSCPQLTRSSHKITIRDFLAGVATNDCEAVVCELYPEVRQALDWLSGRVEDKARVTGTGACVYAAIEKREAARELALTVPQKWHAFVARGRNRSPLWVRMPASDGVI